MKQKLKRTNILKNIYNLRALKLQSDIAEAQNRKQKFDAQISQLDVAQDEKHWQSEAMMKLAMSLEKSITKKKSAQDHYLRILRAHYFDESRKETMLEGLADKYQNKIIEQDQKVFYESLNDVSVMRRLRENLSSDK